MNYEIMYFLHTLPFKSQAQWKIIIIPSKQVQSYVHFEAYQLNSINLI